MGSERKTLLVMLAEISITAGTPVQLSATRSPTTSVTLESLAENTGVVYFADSEANALAGSLAHRIHPNGKVVITGDNHKGEIYELDLSDIWVDASVNSSLVVSFMRRTNKQ